MTGKWLTALFCASVLYLTLFYQLGGLAFVGADEPRYARIGEEMNLRSDYITPTLNFLPWLEKPPLLFWLEAMSFRLFGVGEWSARLPGSLFSLFSLMLMAGLTRTQAGWRPALMNALVLATSGLYFVFARAASTDSLLAATLTLAMCCGFQATRQGGLLWAAGMGIFLGLATLAKGPVAVVLLGAVFGAYFLAIQRLVWTRLQLAAASFCFLGTAAPWFWRVWVENGYSFVSTFWINHHLARFLTDIHHHSQPFWYYLVVLGLGFFPWAVFLVPAARRMWRSRHLPGSGWRFRLFLWLWVLVPMVFFSISTGKLPGYILPVFPPLAAIVALEWEEWLLRTGRAGKDRPGRALHVVFGVGLLLGSVLLAGAYLHYRSLELGLVLAAPLVAGLGWACLQGDRDRPQAAFLTLVGTMTLFASLTYLRAAPVVEDYHSARDLSRQVLPRISKESPLLLYRYFHHTAHYYTRYQTLPEPLQTLVTLRDYVETHPQDRFYLLTQEGGWRDLQLTRPHLLARQGNLYLAEISRPLVKNRALMVQYANSVRLWGTLR